jgi:hypothetical protein
MARLSYCEGESIRLPAAPAAAEEDPMGSRRLVVIAAALAAVLAPAPGAGAAEPAGGDPLSGRALFIGARPFTAGTSPCGACHAIGGASAPFAAALGPELSRTFEGVDRDSVGALLEELGSFPTMAPLYAGKPLTPAERSDLAAFLVEAAGKPAPGGLAVAGYAALGAAIALLLLGLAARRRPGSPREELLARARARPPGRRHPAAAPAPRAEPPVTPAAATPRAHGGAR